MRLNIDIKRAKDGSLLFNTRDAALAVGISQDRGAVRYVKYNTLKAYLGDLGIKTNPLPEYIDEETFFYLVLEVNTARAKAIRHNIPLDVLPALLERYTDGHA